MLNFLLPDKRADHFAVYDGASKQSPVMGIYCQLPSSIPIRFQSQNENLFFKSDSDFNGNFLYLIRAVQAAAASSTDCLTSSYKDKK